ncbi:hypothetical protein [Agromyces sp. Soil535]|uniref:hypothetical protein n=1 Tax=Agromyces sp. Soil535 TaxID=1736390 RepID=UPI0006FA9993|nr:hypothetical protein [Agromyces sp. Soil535]KRE31144.1 hypothetical protein ASG80_01310 [Agromyces sp. Soil535]
MHLAASDTNSAATGGRPPRRDALRWILAVSIGEATGFAIAAGVAIVTIVAGIEDPARLALVIGAGALEGTALAIGQYRGMRVNRPVAWRWITATAAAAAFAWILGMLPSTLGLDLGSPAMLVVVSIGAILLLVSIPLAQWLVLARPRTLRWVPANAGAWLVSILWTFAPSPFIDERSPVALVAALYVAAGVLMAVTFAALTAPVALRLFFPARPGPAAGPVPGA